MGFRASGLEGLREEGFGIEGLGPIKAEDSGFRV